MVEVRYYKPHHIKLSYYCVSNNKVTRHLLSGQSYNIDESCFPGELLTTIFEEISEEDVAKAKLIGRFE